MVPSALAHGLTVGVCYLEQRPSGFRPRRRGVALFDCNFDELFVLVGAMPGDDALAIDLDDNQRVRRLEKRLGDLIREG